MRQRPRPLHAPPHPAGPGSTHLQVAPALLHCCLASAKQGGVGYRCAGTRRQGGLGWLSIPLHFRQQMSFSLGGHVGLAGGRGEWKRGRLNVSRNTKEPAKTFGRGQWSTADDEQKICPLMGLVGEATGRPATAPAPPGGPPAPSGVLNAKRQPAAGSSERVGSERATAYGCQWHAAEAAISLGVPSRSALQSTYCARPCPMSNNDKWKAFTILQCDVCQVM